MHPVGVRMHVMVCLHVHMGTLVKMSWSEWVTLGYMMA